MKERKKGLTGEDAKAIITRLISNGIFQRPTESSTHHHEIENTFRRTVKMFSLTPKHCLRPAFWKTSPRNAETSESWLLVRPDILWKTHKSCYTCLLGSVFQTWYLDLQRINTTPHVFTQKSISACLYLAACSMMQCLHTTFHPQTSPLCATSSHFTAHNKPFYGTLSAVGFTNHNLICQQKLHGHFHSGKSTYCLVYLPTFYQVKTFYRNGCQYYYECWKLKYVEQTGHCSF
jgi:hypothetical protein